MDRKYDIAVCYRIYPGVSKVPPIFADDKIKLAELCLSSLKDAAKNLKVKVWALLDACPPIYEKLFAKYFDSEDLEFVKTSGIGNQKTFKKQLEVLTKQNVSDIVYFAEDDYFYLKDALSNMLALIRSFSNVDFVTPYDHSDYYAADFHKSFKSEKITAEEILWRTVATTTMTFMTTKQALENNYAVFKTYAKKNDDASLWMSLTKHKVSNPALLFKYLFSDRQNFKFLLKAWSHNNKQILLGKKQNLWAPVPSLATHMDSEYLAPEINWNKKFNKKIDKINFIS